MRKMVGRNKRRRTAECIGVCFEPLEPRLLLSGSWAAGVDNPSPDPQPNNQDGFTQESGVLFESTGTSGVDALQQKQSQPQTGTIVDILASAPAIEEFAAADPAPEAAISEGQTPPASSGIKQRLSTMPNCSQCLMIRPGRRASWYLSMKMWPVTNN